MKLFDLAVTGSLIAWMCAGAGCSTTLHEKKPTGLDPGSRTEVKLEGPKVKLVHDF